ncbi:hypothetical protein [Paenibacillus assamensis]|uniref:hypothetical protein n=1 Tax=Paenibacillus assamensis TaxID=311244 RepID=UPI000427DB7C|nr:hypothetical protein [Paenibacillus assamensis]
MNFAILVILIVIAVLLFEINSKLPNRDHVKEAMLRAKIEKRKRNKVNVKE